MLSMFERRPSCADDHTVRTTAHIQGSLSYDVYIYACVCAYESSMFENKKQTSRCVHYMDVYYMYAFMMHACMHIVHVNHIRRCYMTTYTCLHMQQLCGIHVCMFVCMLLCMCACMPVCMFMCVCVYASKKYVHAFLKGIDSMTKANHVNHSMGRNVDGT